MSSVIFPLLATQNIAKAKEKGKEVGNIATLISETILNHQEIIASLHKKVSDKLKQELESSSLVGSRSFGEVAGTLPEKPKQEITKTTQKLKEKIEEIFEEIKTKIPE